MCDLFGMAQALIADPSLVKKSFKGEEDKVIPCLAHLKIGSCHRCRYLKQKDLTLYPISAREDAADAPANPVPTTMTWRCLLFAGLTRGTLDL